MHKLFLIFLIAICFLAIVESRKVGKCNCNRKAIKICGTAGTHRSTACRKRVRNACQKNAEQPLKEEFFQKKQ
jgi:hypothetical protein